MQYFDNNENLRTCIYEIKNEVYLVCMLALEACNHQFLRTGEQKADLVE